MGQCLPVVAPLLTRGIGLAPERIGNLSSLTSVGSCLFLAFGAPVLARLGPVRSLQGGSLLAVLGMAIAASGSWAGLVIAALLLGLSYGPTPPSGSRILAKTAPPRHRTLIFSIKQAGAPAGGALAGLIAAPFAARFGWPSALLLAVAVGTLSAVAIAPLRAMMDVERDPARSVHPRAIFSLANVMTPVRALGENPAMLAISALALSFALVQGVLFSFSVTYLTQIGMALPEAGAAYACLQGAGVFARIFLGFLADRTGRPAATRCSSSSRRSWWRAGVWSRCASTCVAKPSRSCGAASGVGVMRVVCALRGAKQKRRGGSCPHTPPIMS